MILFSAEAILASSTSKFGSEIPLVDDEDIKSSTESTISTSLIQCIPSIFSSSKQTWLVQGICQSEDPKSAVVVGLPHSALKRVSSTEDD